MNAGGHAGQRSRVQSHIQRASKKQAQLPAICAAACEMVRSSTKALAHAATLSRMRSPAVTPCNEMLVHVCAAWAALPRAALPLHRLWRRTPYHAQRSCFQHVQPAGTGISQAAPVLIAQKPFPADGGIRAQGLTTGLPLHQGFQHWRHAWCSTRASRLLHKRAHGYTNTLRMSLKPRAPHPHPMRSH